jgi:hypothetical protein
LLLAEGDGARDEGDNGDDSRCDQQAAQPPDPVAFGQFLGVTVFDAGSEELFLQRVQRRIGRLGPGVGCVEAHATVEVAVVAAPLGPRGGAGGEVPVDAKALAVVVEPTAQSRPLTNQGLVGHLHRRLPAHRVVVEGEQPGRTVGVDDVLGRLVDRGLAQMDPPSRVLVALAQRDEPPEQTPDRGLLGRRGGPVQLLGPTGQRTAQSAQLAILVEKEEARDVDLEQLCQRVLHQWQGTGLTGDLGDDFGDQARLELDAHPRRRIDDGVLELVTGQGRDRHRVPFHESGEVGIPEGPVVEVGPKGEHDTDR